MKTTRELDVYECDATACQMIDTCLPGDEPPLGYHGSVTKITPSGGLDAVWFACRLYHIRSAVENALARSLDNEGGDT